MDSNINLFIRQIKYDSTNKKQILNLTDLISDYNLCIQTSGHRINLMFGKHQTRISFSTTAYIPHGTQGLKLSLPIERRVSPLHHQFPSRPAQMFKYGPQYVPDSALP